MTLTIEHIQELFDSDEYNYLFFGIDFLMPIIDIENISTASVYILVENQDVNYIIEAASDVKIREVADTLT